jgi:hypothetical protein
MEETSNFKKKLAEIDERIIKLQEEKELGEALERLHENEDFIKVILHGYFETEAKRIFELLTIPTKLKRDQLENLMDKMTAIRNYKQYFQTVLINAQMAPDQIQDEENYRKELTAEESIIDTEVEE